MAAFYEMLLCCKLVMSSSAGMDHFLKVPNSVETIVNCLNFCFKMLALQVLEILSVCCYYSNDAAISTFKAFQVFYFRYFIFVLSLIVVNCFCYVM